MAKSGKKRNPLLVFLFVLFLIFIALPLLCIGVSFIGRISPDSVIPDSFSAYVRIPNPVRLAGRVLEHETLPELLADPALAAFAPLAAQIKESAILENKWVRFAAQGTLDGALLPEGRFLAVWEAGIAAPFLRFLPVLAGHVTIPNLYYVQAGKNSRFEYRAEGAVIYIGPYRNLLVASNNSDLFESVLNGASRDGDIRGSDLKAINARNFDIAFLLSEAAVKEALANQDPAIAAVAGQLDFPGPIEAAVSIFPKKLEMNFASPLSSANPAIDRLIGRNAQVSPLIRMLPDATQYSTILSAGSLEELLEAASPVLGPDLSAALDKADSSARLLLRLSVQDILFSWTGTDFAVFGMEGRPDPVYTIRIRDEKKRREIFDKAFRSVFLTENIQAVLDGTRIPRIQLPDFIDLVLQALGVKVPSPYYIVHDDYLFISESADTLLAALNAVRKNAVLPKTETWKALANSASDTSDRSTFSLFYSLDRSLPFFLKGNTAFGAVLRLYRQGLVRLAFENQRVTISLAAIPGSGKGLVPAAGYPLDLGGKTGSAVYSVSSARRGESRILLTRENSALAVNPADKTIYELKNAHPVYVVPAEGLSPQNMNEAAAWVAGGGQATLVNGGMEPVKGFPRSTGARLSSAPAAHGGKLFLNDDDGLVYTVGSDGAVSRWDTVFDAALRSPPSFLEASGKTYAAFYPKSILANEIWLSDAAGKPYPGWPVSVSGIAFGSPLLFSPDAGGRGEKQILAAFITMAGELSVFDENARILPDFPLALPGVFYLQPVYDGSFLWAVASDGTLYQVSLEGTVLYQRVPNLTVKEAGYITAVDVDGDKIPEIFFTGEGNALYGYSRNFISLDGFPLPVWGRPVFADLNGDGKIECFGVGLDNKLYQWQFK
jgi:hypothetical protein